MSEKNIKLGRQRTVQPGQQLIKGRFLFAWLQTTHSLPFTCLLFYRLAGTQL